MLAVVVVIAAISFLSAHRVAGKSTAWNREPSSFLGIAFHKPLSSSVKECAGSRDDPAEGQLCFEKIGTQRGVLGEPGFGMVLATEVDGNVEVIAANFTTDRFPVVDAALVDKFGPPQTIETEEVKSGAGASFLQITHEWRGHDVLIVCKSIAGDVEHGALVAQTKKFEASVAAANQAEAQKMTKSF